ncbi:MAG: hypothetical protein NVS4B2_26060 [Chloroflexota bacterium]
MWTHTLPGRPFLIVAVMAMLLLPGQVAAKGGSGDQVANYSGLTSDQASNLYSIARDTWKFYQVDVDPNTHLPMDNVTFAGGAPAPTAYGKYTSAANIGVYLWAVVAARDLGLVKRPEARALIEATLNEVTRLQKYNGFLYQWYDTTTGQVIKGPNDVSCATEPTPTFDNCYFISNVDNGLYASGLIVVRSAFPELRHLVSSLMDPMDFGIFYDGRPETHCNTNPAVPGNQPTGQMYGGIYVGLPVDQGNNWQHYYHNGALYSDPRISAYIGMGLHQMPGNVWWRSWRTLPPKAPYADCQATDPDFSWQGQWPVPGYWQIYNDPQSGQPFNVWEGHYVYPPTGLTFIPTWAGGMFEGQMDNQIVPETSWGPRSFGLADYRWAQVQIDYATNQLGYPVWGISPSSTPDDTGNYHAYGVTGYKWPYPEKKGLSQCYGCNGPDMENVVTPHASFIALDVAPQQAYNNIQNLKRLYPDIYGVDGFFDAVAPKSFTYDDQCNPKGCTTYTVGAGQVGHRYLVLDQSMIMAALDNALNNRGMQRHFADDPVSWAARTYLSMETMSIAQ